MTSGGTQHDAHDEFAVQLTRAVQGLGLSLQSAQLAGLRRHYQLMVEANRTMNLTRIVEPGQAAVRHYADSLAALAWATQRSVHIETLLDLGSGAGFPAVPLAVMRPDWSITAIDGTRKKVEFVRQAAADLGLSNLTVLHAHSEHWERAPTFDLVVARAVAPLAKLLRSAVDRLAPGGCFLAYKTAVLDATEQKEAEACLAKMPLRAEQRFDYELSVGDQRLRRALHVFSRTS